MIVRVVRPGSDMPGLAAYMWGPGKAEEHTDQRMIASTGAREIAIGESSLFYRGERATCLDSATLDSTEARREGREIERSWRLFREDSKVPVAAGALAARQSGEEAQGETVAEPLRVDSPWTTETRQERTGWNRPHVFHVVFSLGPDEGELSDEVWSRIATDYVQGMGFAGVEGQSECRWGAWRHGKSAGGNDHMHVAVSLVRDDGRWADVHRSFVRSRRLGDELESKYGLRPVKDTRHQRGMPGASRGEQRRTQEAKPGTREQISERQRLAMVVRTAATHATTEKQFVADVLRQGVRVRPRFSKGGAQVEGASFKFREGECDWLGGGQLARDLTLPKLRSMWVDSPDNRAEALPTWKGREGVSVKQAAPSWAPSWNAAQQALSAWALRVENLDPDDDQAWAATSRDAASVASELAHGSAGRQYQLLAGAAQELARGAQLRRPPASPPADEVRVACRHLNLLLRSGSKSDAAGWWAIWQQFSRVSQAVHSAQHARGENVRAQRLEKAARSDLQAVTTGLRNAAGATRKPTASRVTSTRHPSQSKTNRGEERGR